MKNFKFLALLSTFILTLNGCANVGNKSVKDVSESAVHGSITKGVTTMNEVKTMFGSPIKTSFTDGGSVIWTYTYDDTSALTPETVGSVILTLGLAGTKSRGTRNELVVMFDENNVVKNFSMSNSPIEAGTGLF